MHVSNFAITKAKPKEKPYKLSDGAGLHLLVEANGSKLWRHGGPQADIAWPDWVSKSWLETRRDLGPALCCH
jgi:hypothetical protein